MPGMTPHPKDIKKTFMYMDKFLTWKYTNVIKPIETLICPIKILRMENSIPQMRDQLLKITSDIRIMAHIGRGELWSEDDINRIYVESTNDIYTNDTEKKYFDWLIMNNDDVIGYISLRDINIKSISNDNKSAYKSNKIRNYRDTSTTTNKSKDVNESIGTSDEHDNNINNNNNNNNNTNDNNIDSNSLQIRVFVRDQGNGYGKRAVFIMLNEYRRRIGDHSKNIYAIVDVSNIPSNKLFENMKWSRVKSDILAYGRRSHIYSSEVKRDNK